MEMRGHGQLKCNIKRKMLTLAAEAASRRIPQKKQEPNVGYSETRSSQFPPSAIGTHCLHVAHIKIPASIARSLDGREGLTIGDSEGRFRARYMGLGSRMIFEGTGCRRRSREQPYWHEGVGKAIEKREAAINFWVLARNASWIGGWGLSQTSSIWNKQFSKEADREMLWAVLESKSKV